MAQPDTLPHVQSPSLDEVRNVVVGPATKKSQQLPVERIQVFPGTVGLANDADEALEPSPLPSDWLITGDPKPRMQVTATAKSGRLSSGVWCCEPSRFNFTYVSDEYVHIIRGRVTVLAEGVVHHLEPGSTAIFPKGLTAQWTVHEPVHKTFVLLNPPRWRRVVNRLLKRR